MESLQAAYQNEIKALKNEVDDNYNERFRHSYRYIMAILEKQHPELKMDKLAAGVTKYTNKQAAKKDAKKRDPAAAGETIIPHNTSRADPPLDPQYS